MRKRSNERLSQALEKLRRKDYVSAPELFLEIFDGVDGQIAACLGWLFQRRECEGRDIERSLEYYRIAAADVSSYANLSLADYLVAQDRIDEAIAHYSKAAADGSAKAAFKSYGLLRRCA